MDKEQFKQLFAIAYLACRFAQLKNTNRSDDEMVHEQMDRMSDASWIHFCEIWPEKEHDNPPPQGEKEE